MMRDHWELKRQLNARAQREAEDARIEAIESEYMPIYWLLIFVVIVAGIVSWLPPSWFQS